MTFHGDHIDWRVEQPFSIKRSVVAKAPLDAELTIRRLENDMWIITIVSRGPNATSYAQVQVGPTRATRLLRAITNDWLRASCAENGIRITGFDCMTIELVNDRPFLMSTSGTFHLDK